MNDNNYKAIQVLPYSAFDSLTKPTFIIDLSKEGPYQYSNNQLILYINLVAGLATDITLEVSFSNDGGAFFNESIEDSPVLSGTDMVSNVYKYVRDITNTSFSRIAIPTKDKIIMIKINASGNTTATAIGIDAIVGVV